MEMITCPDLDMLCNRETDLDYNAGPRDTPIVYAPLHVAGIPYVRSLMWLVSLSGILLVLIPII
ncbi:MAPEG family protein [Paraburkholderia sediminicola]|uniref:hypothetical protein n=1 Tax=Paraburkholderia sediminicola TaxID=458836 RepID=UPI0038BB49F8